MLIRPTLIIFYLTLFVMFTTGLTHARSIQEQVDTEPDARSAQASRALTMTTASVHTRQPQIEVAFVLDTTGSMTKLLEGAKRKIWSIASKIAGASPQPKLRVGLVAYRDRQDEYVTQHFQLSRDIDSVHADLTSLKAEGGGDAPEAVGQALGESVLHMDWTEGQEVMKVIFVVGDAPPKRYNDGWDARHWAQKAAQKGIIVNTIRCGDMASTGRHFQALAALGQGAFASIDQSGGMVAVATPFDAEIQALNRELAKTLVYGGSARERAKVRSKVKTLERLDADSAANRVQFLKKSGLASTQGLALKTTGAHQPDVEDLVANPKRLDAMNQEELPSRLRGLSKRAQRRYLQKQARSRRALEKRLSALSEKREAFINLKGPKKQDAFDVQVMDRVTEQAKQFGLKL